MIIALDSLYNCGIGFKWRVVGFIWDQQVVRSSWGPGGFYAMWFLEHCGLNAV